MALFVFLATALLIAGVSVWRGYVLSILWGWFAVPAFGLPALSIPLAIGVALITGMLAENSTTPKETDAGTTIAKIVLGPALVLLVGWIVTKFL